MAGRLSDSLSLATRGLGEHILLLVDEGALHQPLREAVGEGGVTYCSYSSLLLRRPRLTAFLSELVLAELWPELRGGVRGWLQGGVR